MNVAMDQRCKEVQAEEYDIRVAEATTLHTCLRFALLASTWLPRLLGVFLWSALHVILLVYVPLVLLGVLVFLMVPAIIGDVIFILVRLEIGLFMALVVVIVVILFPLAVLVSCLIYPLVATIVWIWHVITCQCCTLPVRSPGQGVVQYILSAGGTLRIPFAQPELHERAPAAPTDNPVSITDLCTKFDLPVFSVDLFKHVWLVSFPYWRLKLVSFCSEIVPSYDALAVN